MKPDNGVAADLAEALAALPSSPFRNWAVKANFEGYLGVVLRSVVVAGEAANQHEALRVLESVYGKSDHRKIPAFIARCDMEGSSPGSALRRLLSLVEWEKPHGERELARFCGTIGHTVIPPLLRGESLLERDELNVVRMFGPEAQLPLFADHENGENGIPESGVVLRRADFLRRLRAVRHRCLAEKTSDGIPMFSMRRLERLRSLVGAVLGNGVRSLMERCARHESQGVYLEYYSLLSWITAIELRLTQGKQLIFSEISVLGQRHHLSGGRIDALAVYPVRRKQFRRDDRALLTGFMRGSYSSLAHLTEKLDRVFGADLHLVIKDWKFYVGDGPRGNLPELEMIRKGPLKAHEKQMHFYLVVASLGQHLASHVSSIAWPERPRFREGELVYFVPDLSPIVHRVVLSTPSEQERAFAQLVVGNWGTAQGMAGLRETDNVVIGYVATRLQEKLTGKRMAVRRRTKEEAPQPALFSQNDLGRRTAVEVVESYRGHQFFVDEFRILEEVIEKRNGDTRSEKYLLLHWERACDAVRSGHIKQGEYFDPEEGGRITCLLPGHEDTETLMRVFLRQGFFHCVRCGVSGFVVRGTQESTFRIPEAHRRMMSIRWEKTWQLRIPAALHRIMKTAQGLLVRQFPKSGGERYLLETRRVHRNAPAVTGVGFGTNEVVGELLSSGYKYDELIRYGFVGFSEKISSSWGLCPLLRRYGMSLEGMRRPVERDGKEVWGFPYFTLADRVTFPLMLWGNHTNFYGRAIGESDRRFSHRKLSVKEVHVPHGMFREEVLSWNYPEIIVTEAAIDALSLMTWEYVNVVAMIGVSNAAIAEALALSGHDVAIALDNDAAGCETTRELGEHFDKLGVVGVRDFSAEFSVACTEQEPWKDYNELLVRLDGRKPTLRSFFSAQ